MGDKMYKKYLAGSLLAAALPAHADYVTVISFGGANKEAQRAAFYEPFKQATGTSVVHGSYNGDLAKLRKMVQLSHVSWDVVEVEAPELALSWNGGIYDFDYWALPKGISKAEQARRFVAFASQPEAQRSFAEKIAYGPVNRQAIAALDPKVSANLPTAPANLAGGVGMDAAFWAANGAALEERFARWAER